MMNINSAIGEIIDSQKGPFNSIVIKIECPLNTGIRVSCKMYTADGEKSIPLACGSKPFFYFVKAEKAASKHDINVVEIMIEPNGAWRMQCDYDSNLQKHAQEMIN